MISAAAPAQKPAPTKTQFILSLPNELPIADVVARAAKAGVVVSAKYVSNIRGAARARSESRRGATPRARSKPARGGAGARSKSDFIRAQPDATPASAVVLAARNAGLRITAKLVYKVRARGPVKSAAPATRPSARGVVAGASSETFRDALETVLGEAIDVFGEAIERGLITLLTEDLGAPTPTRARRAPALASERPTPTPYPRPARAARPIAPRPKKAARPLAAKPRAEAPAVKPITKPVVKPVVADDHSYRPRILEALDAAPEGLSRVQLIRTLELKPSEEARLGTALIALRASKSVTLDGLRRQAVYRRTRA